LLLFLLLFLFLCDSMEAWIIEWGMGEREG